MYRTIHQIMTKNLVEIIYESISYKGYLLHSDKGSIKIRIFKDNNLHNFTTLENSNMEEAKSYIDLLG